MLQKYLHKSKQKKTKEIDQLFPQPAFPIQDSTSSLQQPVSKESEDKTLSENGSSQKSSSEKQFGVLLPKESSSNAMEMAEKKENLFEEKEPSKHEILTAEQFAENVPSTSTPFSKKS